MHNMIINIGNKHLDNILQLAQSGKFNHSWKYTKIWKAAALFFTIGKVKYLMYCQDTGLRIKKLVDGKYIDDPWHQWELVEQIMEHKIELLNK